LVSQTTTCPFTLRQALPEPKRASKDAFGKISIGHFRISTFSKLMKFIAKAAIPDAEEAIPELWGLFCVSIVK
jgi:hypothetical protein